MGDACTLPGGDAKWRRCASSVARGQLPPNCPWETPSARYFPTHIRSLIISKNWVTAVSPQTITRPWAIRQLLDMHDPIGAILDWLSQSCMVISLITVIRETLPVPQAIHAEYGAMQRMLSRPVLLSRPDHRNRRRRAQQLHVTGSAEAGSCPAHIARMAALLAGCQTTWLPLRGDRPARALVPWSHESGSL